MAENIYPKGIITFERNPKAPDFVLGSMAISLTQFKEWINTHQELLTDYKGELQIKFQILKGKDGRINFPVDTFKPQPKDSRSAEQLKEQNDPKPQRTEAQENGDLPF